MNKRKKDDNPLPKEINAVLCSFDGGGLKDKCLSNSFKLYHAKNMMNKEEDILIMKCDRCGNLVAVKSSMSKVEASASEMK